MLLLMMMMMMMISHYASKFNNQFAVSQFQVASVINIVKRLLVLSISLLRKASVIKVARHLDGVINYLAPAICAIPSHHTVEE